MHHNVRIIPRLDVKNETVVKGIHLEGLRVVGTPGDLARKYYENGADEILYMDAVASLYDRNSLEDIVKNASEDVFIPITVGGGIRTVDDIRRLLHAGADKVAINTAAVRSPAFLGEASKMFGSQCIVLSVEAKKISDESWEAYVDTGRESTGIDVMEWIRKAEDLGVGEILITSIDKEGTKSGFEQDLIDRVTSLVSIPVIVCGGAGTPQHVEGVAKSGNVSAVAVASVLHYDIATIEEIKHCLDESGVPVRISE